MSISKPRVRSAVGKSRNDPSSTHISNGAPKAAVAAAGAAEPSRGLAKESLKVWQKQKSKIFSLSTINKAGGVPPKLGPNKIANGAAIAAAVGGNGNGNGSGISNSNANANVNGNGYGSGNSSGNGQGLNGTATAGSSNGFQANPTAAAPAPAGTNPNTNSNFNTTISSATTATITTTTTTTLPQSTLLKIEPFVPSLATRLQKPLRRSYSTLSTTTLKKRLQTANANVVVNLEIANNSKKPALVQGLQAEAIAGHTGGGLPKVPRPPQTPRRRQPLRGVINRQRSKSTSSSNSASNRPATSVTCNGKATSPALETPCSSPQNVVVIAQPNGICRIQRNAKEQEKLPDRINYDKRGLTAIPIFENESNLRLLSLQHNLINTFHIPKEVPKVETKPEAEASTPSPPTPAARPPDLHISNSANYLQPPPSQSLLINRPRNALPLGSPTTDYPASSPLALQPKTAFGTYLMQRNKLLQRSINLNNVTLQQNGLAHMAQTPPPQRFGIRKSQSFVSNFNLQLQIPRRGAQNAKAALFRKAEMSRNLTSFDSTTSNLTSDSASTLQTVEPSESPLDEDAIESELAIKNQQLLINYGNIFQHLVFLDLYDNQIERIANLDGLTSLSVLLLGKNRISDISGLASLKGTLRVLDLHGNKLCSVGNKINCLRELRSLNLAGNQIRQINHNDFLGLSSLKELNLKRNKLKRVNGFQHLTALERLWLCHNDLHKVDDMSTIAKATRLVEVTIENNPVSLAGDCVSFLVSHLPKLQTLSQMPITEQVRAAAMTWRSNKELSEQSSQQGNKEQLNLIRREEIISNARTNWELLRSQQMLQHCNGGGTKGTKPIKASKHNVELEKITEANEQSYEEFIKLPPIQPPTDSEEPRDKEERISSASSLGPNVNSSSSCYTSADEDTNDHNQPGLMDGNDTTKKSLKAIKLDDTPLDQNKAQLCHVADNPGRQQTGRSASGTPAPPAVTPPPNCAPTLTIQFPLESNDTKTSNGSPSRNQSPHHSSNHTSALNGAAAPMAPPASPASPTPAAGAANSAAAVVVGAGCRRYTAGTLMRSQTVVGTGGYATKTTANATQAGGPGNGHLRQQSAKQHPANAGGATVAAPNGAQTAMAGLTAPHQQTTASPTYSSAAAVAASTTAITMATAVIGGPAMATSPTHSNGSAPAAPSKSTNTNSCLGYTVAPLPNGLPTKPTASEREREQGGDYLIEICGRYLNIYGQGALRFIDKQWNPAKANDVHTLNFSYINFNNITAVLSRIKVRFPHAENFVFRETNISCLGQLNALAELQGITALCIDPEGNPLTAKDLWRQYAVYRLSHWGLKTLNGQEVTKQEVEQANSTYSGLSDLILWSMPDAMLQPLLTRLRLDESCTASKMQPKQWLQKPENHSLRLVVGKEALQWKKATHHDALHALPTPQQIRQLQAHLCADANQLSAASSLSSSAAAAASAAAASSISINTSTSATLAGLTQRERGKIFFTLMMENTCNAVVKLHRLEQIWPSMLSGIVRNTLLDYSQLDVYVRNLMAEIMK